METDKYVFFCGHKPNEYGVHIFSQWYPSKFIKILDDKNVIEFVHMEQYMMAHKALLFGDKYHYDKIMSCSDACKIKNLGRRVRGFKQNIWDKNKLKIVISGNKLKFQQNPELMTRLLETGDKIIVEAACYDKEWGIGLTAQQAIKIPESKWPGKNLLGKALMKVRDEAINGI
ncbi:hypothetical protein QLL95_gp0686 [Cotonvirus japonicus]|uniref:NADAR domain-containing protein n=1 Tax=Cotonvirus japonicus TaxID=2811091 RepID=A0ABM7NTP5_9VIRU|nr:hypothetical protein QLL95_gp0686 [Cotonvirus japonicus]BCS83437.1 hypothetical protein [Cotonvirus japonicus]